MNTKKFKDLSLNEEAKALFVKMRNCKSEQKKFKMIKIAAVIALVIISLLCSSFTKNISIFIGVVGIIVLCVLLGKKEKEESREFTLTLEKFIEASLADYVEHPTFSDGSDLEDLAQLMSPSMILRGSYLDACNMIKGIYDGYEFITMDIHCFDLKLDKQASKEKTEKQYRKGTVYSEGIYTRTTFNRSIEGTVIITSSDYEPGVSTYKLQQIQMDNSEFSKQFSVYANNQITAFTIVDALFMESLLNIDINKRPNAIIIEDNQVVIGMPFRGGYKTSPVPADKAEKLAEKSFIDHLCDTKAEETAITYLEKEMSTLSILYDTLNIDNRIFS
ncbi:MAG: DUF3137 domain-containing protein [Eubacterium sp.]